jgi:hypothetical protein
VALDPQHRQPERLPPPPAPDNGALERHVQVLEDQIHLLQQQVDFLEQLLQRSAANRQLTGESPPERESA